MSQLLTLPNLLSLSRVGLALMMSWTVYHSNWYVAVVILWTATSTDVFDGYLARKKNLTSAIGGLMDHGSDAFFVTLTIAALAHHNWAPVALVCIIPAAFIQYTLDSKALAGHPLNASSLGKYNGISYFVFAGFPVMQLTLGITLIPFDWFVWIGWGLVVTSAISMVDRLVTLLSNKP